MQGKVRKFQDSESSRLGELLKKKHGQDEKDSLTQKSWTEIAIFYPMSKPPSFVNRSPKNTPQPMKIEFFHEQIGIVSSKELVSSLACADATGSASLSVIGWCSK